MLIVNPHRPFTRLKLPRRLRQRREHAHLTLPLSLTQLRILSTGSDTARIFALSIRIDAEDYRNAYDTGTLSEYVHDLLFDETVADADTCAVLTAATDRRPYRDTIAVVHVIALDNIDQRINDTRGYRIDVSPTEITRRFGRSYMHYACSDGVMADSDN